MLETSTGSGPGDASSYQVMHYSWARIVQQDRSRAWGFEGSLHRAEQRQAVATLKVRTSNEPEMGR